MSIKVYFDNVLINEQYYAGLSNNFELFGDNFKLGATPSNQFKLQIAKEGVIAQPNIIQLNEETDIIASLKADNIQEQDYTFDYTLSDKMVDLEFYYDASEIFENGYTTLYNIALDICSKADLILGTEDFRGYDKQINWYDNTRTAREYIGMIAELNGGFARVEGNTLYFRKQKTNSVKTIDINDCENFNIGEYHNITRVVYELGAVKYEFGDETGNTLYLNSDNVFITEESEVQAIFNDIQNFEFYSFSTNNCPIDYNVKAGDIITFTDGENNYPTIAQYDLTYFGGWYGGYDLSVNTERQEETQIVGDKERIKNLQIIVDRDANIITQVVQEVDEQNEKISQVTQTVNEINSKISDVADITVSGESFNAYVHLEGVNTSQPINIKIHPTTQSIDFLYPRSLLYPGSNIYPKASKIKFVNTSTSEVFYWTLPTSLWYYDASSYDDLELSYGDGETSIVTVNRKCSIDSNGTISLLATPTTETYAYPTPEELTLTDGDYNVFLDGYSNAYLYVQLMASNIYTTQFATKAEVTSEINQKAGEITSTVSATYATKGELNTTKTQIKQTTDSISATVDNNNTKVNIIAKINDNTSQAQIDADVINLSANDILNLIAGNQINLTSKNITIASNNFSVDSNGNITANGGKIANWSITGGKIYAGDGGSTKTAVMQAPSDNAYWVFAAGGNTHTTYGDCPFRVDKFGNLFATNAEITGKVNATSGTFQNCTISNSCTVAAATITGTLTANHISGGTLNGNNVNVTNLNADKIITGTINGIPFKNGSISNGSISSGSITNSTYKFQGDNEVVAINKGMYGAIEGYRSDDGTTTQSQRRYSIVAFTNGGRFQTFNSSGTMASYFDHQGAHTSSDERLKNNINIINKEKSINIIESLNPITFTYKDDENTYHRGLIAQEVKKVLNDNGIEKQIYEINEEGMYSLNYVELIPDLINCIKYLKKEIDILKEGK